MYIQILCVCVCERGAECMSHTYELILHTSTVCVYTNTKLKNPKGYMKESQIYILLYTCT